MKVMLIFPPQSTPTLPYLGIPSLTAYLKSRGVNIIQRDFNVSIYDKILTGKYLSKIYDQVCRNFDDLEKRSTLTAYQQQHYDVLFAARAAPHLIERIDEAKKIIRNKKYFYEFLKYLKAKKDIYDALELVSAAYYPTKLGFSSFEMQESRKSSDRVIEAAQNKKENLFIKIYKKDFLTEIYSESPDIIGISITNPTQIIPGLTLAHLLKSQGIHITVGGSIFSRLVHVLQQKKELFTTFFDSVIISEGERPLFELVKSISAGKSLKNVPNLVYYDGAHVHTTELCLPEPINSLPPPCFDGFPLNLYFSPHPVLPLLSSRGCYWGRCAFCDHDYIYGKRYEPRDTKKVVDDLQWLKNTYKTDYFAFADEALAPHTVEALSEEIIKRTLDVHLIAYTRFEPHFTHNLLGKMAEAGFKCLLFGLESGCDRVLTFMKKWICKQTAADVCKASAQVGIWNHLFLFFGFPTETKEEAKETVEFVFENKDVINSVASGTFVLSKHSPVKMHPEAYKVDTIQSGEDLDFQLSYEYTVATGLNHEEAEKVYRNFQNQLRINYSDSAVWSAFNREHLLLYLVHYGNDLSALYREVTGEDTPSTKGLDWPALCPRLKDSVVLNVLSFDLVKIQENMRKKSDAALPRQKTYVVYDTASAKILSVTRPAKDILKLCDGKTSAHCVASLIAEKYAVSVGNAEEETVSFLKKMVKKGFVIV